MLDIWQVALLNNVETVELLKFQKMPHANFLQGVRQSLLGVAASDRRICKSPVGVL